MGRNRRNNSGAWGQQWHQWHEFFSLHLFSSFFLSHKSPCVCVFVCVWANVKNRYFICRSLAQSQCSTRQHHSTLLRLKRPIGGGSARQKQVNSTRDPISKRLFMMFSKQANGCAVVPFSAGPFVLCMIMCFYVMKVQIHFFPPSVWFWIVLFCFREQANFCVFIYTQRERKRDEIKRQSLPREVAKFGTFKLVSGHCLSINDRLVGTLNISDVSPKK